MRALIEKLAPPVLGALALILLLCWVVALGEKAHVAKLAKDLDGRLSVANRDLATCRGNEVRLGAAVEEQGAAIRALKALGEQREKEAALALQQAKSEAQRHRREALKIAKAEPVGNHCEAAAELLREGLQ